MFKLFLNKLHSQPESEENILALQAENQRLRLDLEQAQTQVKRLQEALLHQQSGQANEQAASLQARFTALLAELGSPAAQFLTQIYLLEKQGKEIQARDTLAIARSLLRVLGNVGVEVSEEPGETVAYNPDNHHLLGANHMAQSGQVVLVRTPGLVYRKSGQGVQRLVKAGVQPEAGADQSVQ